MSLSFSRRRVLELMAATPAFAACSPSSPLAVRKRFVGQSPARGHVLRDPVLRERAMAMRSQPAVEADVIIVGGGVAGMAAAWRLRRAGLDRVHLLELESAVGGTAAGGTLPRSAYPLGAHYLPYPPPEFRALHTLLRDLDLVLGTDDDGAPVLDPRAICRAPVERHRMRGMWHEGTYPAAGQTPAERAQWERWQEHLRSLDGRRGADGRRLFDLPIDRSSAQLRHLDQISMARYLDALGLHGERLRWSIDYACLDDYGCTAAQTSAFAGLHHFLARGLESEHDDRFLLTWPNGNAHLVEQMQRRAQLENRLHRGTAALHVDPDEGRVIAYALDEQQFVCLRAPVVLWAAPRFVLQAVLPPGRDPLPRDALAYTPWLVASVQVEVRPTGIGAPLAWDNVQVGAQHLGYVVASHQEPLTQHDRGSVLTYYEPWTADDAPQLHARRRALFEASLDDLCERAIAALDGMHPGLRRHVTHVDVARWGHAMIRPEPGFLFGPSRRLAAADVGRVLPCAADVGGLPLFEEAFAGGVRVAETALERLGRGDPSLL